MDILRALLVSTIIAALQSCSDRSDGTEEPTLPRQASVTLMVTENSLGDNGYNDCAAEGVMAFAAETGTPLHLLRPDSREEAESMYRRWLTDNAGADSAVFIAGSSAYAEMIAACKPELTGRGARVLLFEADMELDGIPTVMIDRYGAGYLAGAMSAGFDALILAAAPGFSTLESAIEGFSDARGVYAGSHNGIACDTELHYIAGDESGFSMPDSVYRYIARRSADRFIYDEMIFPLLGGSQTGVVDRINDDEFSAALAIGMDTDMSGLSLRLPFSVEIRIGEVVRALLHDWHNGAEWPVHHRPGMADGAADIVVNPLFGMGLILLDDRYSSPGEFDRRCRQFRDEALQKEKEHYATERQ